MSDAFAIAAVTACMSHLLRQRLADATASGIVNANATVSAQPPDRISQDEQQPISRLNLFLYEVSSNAGWANAHQPSRDLGGARVANPFLALDLHYLVSAFGIADFESEILLAHAMQLFHETPGLSRAAIREVLDPGPPDAPMRLPQAFRQRAVALAEQIERITITPRFLKTDEMSKIWTSLQAHYRSSMAYDVTVVLIESTKPARSAPPVLTRGAGDRGVAVGANLLPPVPTLAAVEVAGGQPVATFGDTITLRGHHLDRANVSARFRNQRLERDLTVASTSTATQADAVLANATPANTWAAGVYDAQLEVTRAGEANPRRTNILPLVLAPSIKKNSAAPTVLPGNRLRVKLECIPPLRVRQSASLFVGAHELPMKAPAGPPADVTKPTFVGPLPSDMLVSGRQHLLRLRVDGIESRHILLPKSTDPHGTPPRFDPDQLLTIP